MTVKYTNVTRARGSAEFARTSPSFDGSSALFKVAEAKPNIAGTIVPMVRGTVRLTTPVNAASQDVAPAFVNESIAIEFNVRRGGVVLASMRDEVVRLLDAAVADYQLANGIVPPSEAAFSSV